MSESETTPDELRILQHLNESLKCKICNGVLISPVGIDCGHVFCSYCLSLLSSLSNRCPECSIPFRNVAPQPHIDARIEQLVVNLHPSHQQAYQAKKLKRSEKTSCRSKKISDL